MKKILFSIFLCTSALLSTGCRDEDFNPKGEFKDKYILNCVLRSDTTVQTLTLSGSYNVDGFDPSANNNDPALKGADIRMWIGDSVYIFREREAPRSDSSRYNTPVRYYYAENVSVQINKSAEILAVLPNGRKLHASTKIPAPVFSIYTQTDSIIPIKGRDYVQTGWVSFSKQNTFYYPRYSLVYLKIENGNPVRHIVNLPVRYVRSGGKDVPVYASPTTDTKYSVELDAINRTMKEISDGDPNKKNYVVLAVMVNVLTLDMNLSGYYSSARLADDGFSVKLDQTDFTNVEGGLGIFGSYTNTEYAIRLDKNYIYSFGYRSRLEE